MGINEYIKIGSRIKELRQSKGLTQREMAKRLNLSYSTYSNYENNYREPKFDIIEKAADILGVTIEFLLNSDIPPELNKEYELKRGVFIDYLCSLGYAISTPIEMDDYSPAYYISHNNKCYVVSIDDMNALRNEASKYISYLMNSLLEKSWDLIEFEKATKPKKE